MVVSVHPDLTASFFPNNLSELQSATVIDQLLTIGAALSGAQDLQELLELILQCSREITCSDAGSVYLVDRSLEAPVLLFKVTQNFSWGGGDIPDRALFESTFREHSIPLAEKSLVGYVALTGSRLNLPDAYHLSTSLPYQFDQSFDQKVGYRTRSVLVLPMCNQQGEVIGVLQLINRKCSPDVVLTPETVLAETRPYSLWEEQVISSLASQAAISIERHQLQANIVQLFEGFVQASVQVIEARDPATSGHSERVAQLTVRLSQEINDLSRGELGSIWFSDRQLREIHYAALLHDFGKVGVPEVTLRKPKKLHPDHLQSIRNRFHFAQRTLERDCAQAKLRLVLENSSGMGGSLLALEHRFWELDQHLARAIAQLNSNWELIVQFSEPSAGAADTFLVPEEDLQVSLKQLTHQTYLNENECSQPLLTDDELEQLLTPQGTLTEDERRLIETHVTHTYEFLRKIPWTTDLQQICDIAYCHHEKLDGSGYPRGLKRPEIPVQAQIMAVADIYDALTAGDRPYKPRLSVKTALRILRQEAAKGRINQEIVQLFVDRQVFEILGHTLSLD